MIAPEQRRVLLDRARRALSSLLAPRSSAGTPPATGSDSPLPGHNGIFVTLRCRGELHGCIGTLDAGLPLGRAVEGCSISAARDPRFPPLAASDLPETRIEISVMGPGRVVAGPGEIRAGTDGLIVTLGARRGLLLPQVATEHGWDASRLLVETCLKAGLPAGGWKAPGARVEAFEAEVFGEDDPGPGVSGSAG